MSQFDADLPTITVRTIVVSVALQTLVGRLLLSGLLDKGDLIAMCETGLQLAADLAGLAGEDVFGERLAQETEAWWNRAAALGGG